jgi:hypothetical protein
VTESGAGCRHVRPDATRTGWQNMCTPSGCGSHLRWEERQ